MKHDDVAPGPVRGHAGNWLETEFLADALTPVALGLAGALSLGAVGLAAWLGTSIGVIAAAAVLLGGPIAWARTTRTRVRHRKGFVAEREVGRALEQAITANHCAIAHNVQGVADTGDIDHLIATPERVWIVETKYRRVPRSEFPRVLARVRSNVDRVEKRYPETPVRGCLVLAYEGAPVRSKRDAIRVYNNGTFRSELLRELVRERGTAKVVDDGVANDVWTLGGGSPVDRPAQSNPPPPVETAVPTPSRGAPLDEIRREHPKAYERWSPKEDAELRRLHTQGASVGELSIRFGRQPSAIRSRLRKLGIV